MIVAYVENGPVGVLVKYGTVGGVRNRANGVDVADEGGRRERIWLLCKIVVKWS
jgi:hypothetical protein